MDKENTLPYEAPEALVFEVIPDSAILQASKRDIYDTTIDNPFA